MFHYLKHFWRTMHGVDLSKHRVHTHRYEDLCM